MSSITFSLIQTDLSWENKTANLQMLEQKINSIGKPTQIVVLPEMFSTGFSMKPAELAEDMNGPSVEWMRRMATTHKVVVTGSLIIQEDGKYFNRMIWMLPNGHHGHYDKRHLFAYADEDKYYTPGTERMIASVNGWKIHLLVCYDLRFPVWSRQSPERGEAEYDVLLYVANWPERRSNAWRTLLKARAIENQCFVIGLNRVGRDGKDLYYRGDSMVVDAMGETLYEKADEEDVFTITLEKDQLTEVREKLPFLKDADAFKLLL
jgi:omega-amidase